MNENSQGMSAQQKYFSQNVKKLTNEFMTRYKVIVDNFCKKIMELPEEYKKIKGKELNEQEEKIIEDFFSEAQMLAPDLKEILGDNYEIITPSSDVIQLTDS